MSIGSPLPNQYPVSPPAGEEKSDGFPPPSKLLPHDVIWYRMFLWPA